MKVLVTYMSQTGNTKKVAEAIFGEIDDTKEIKELKDVDSLEKYDLSFIGFPIHAFGPANQGKEFLLKHSANKNVAIFITHAAFEDHALIQTWLDSCFESASQANLLGTFNCQGELSAEIAEFLKQSDDPQMQEFGNQRDSTLGQPDEPRLEKAKTFAREIMSKR